MAKSRSRSKTSSSKKSTRKGTRRARPAKRAAARPKPARIELRPIRTKLRAHVGALGAAIEKSETPRPELEEALKRMSRWLDDIQAICGPDMMIPVSVTRSVTVPSEIERTRQRVITPATGET